MAQIRLFWKISWEKGFREVFFSISAWSKSFVWTIHKTCKLPKLVEQALEK